MMDTLGASESAAEDGPFRLGLIGAGRMGRTHLAAISESPLVRVAGVVDSNPAARAAVLASGVPAFVSIADMLAECSIDGALIAVPTDQHVSVLGVVLGAGVPALCEKPCGLTVEDAVRCASLAAAAGMLLQVAYWRRFVPDLVELRRRLLDGEFGDILAVNCYQWDAAPPPAEFRGSSGGIFVDMGVHEFDQLRWLTGQEFATVEVASSGGAPADDPDCAQLVAELDGGSTAMVSLGRWHPAGDSCKVEVFGTKGTASVLFLDPARGDAAFHHALRAQAENFAAAVRGDAAGGASVADAVAAMKVATAARAKQAVRS